ncbi:dephospho-CoA kinase [Actinoplanes sp. TBRC 11911]|uniref:dephospho-CoA kinase n=1 Tax=Actinoplanes sp. TBRC 11911 TaxID=2729386 RepID=UPI00145EAC63|nr:dephospho-CoA kinase [Actinoplanes sp. TBRC 11911]NMO56688.1 dephospho-CoA kinase [Actinoplanes sp. TBRC 11911]
MLKVGLTGGIGAGKSEVARRLAHHGAVIIDADVLSREVVAPGTPGLDEIVEAFGPAVLTADGALDRPALGAKVFGDDEARRRLEKIVHPRVRARTAELTRTAPHDAIVVNDVPLLVETGLAPAYHLVIVVEAAPDARIARLVATRGMTEAQAAARIAAQADDAARHAAADMLLPNEGDLDDLHAQVDALFRDRLRPFEANVRHGLSAPIDSHLRIVGPDPSWPAEASRLIARIEHALRAHPDAHAHHIGSTAVPGLPAKDIIDLMLGVRTLTAADALADLLVSAGFPRRPGEWADNARGIPGETWPKRMHGNADPARPVNLHVRVIGSPGWRFALLMRDHLRAAPDAREGYAAAKAALVARLGDDRFAYADAKEPWFDEEARAADDWAEQTGWQPDL